MKSRYYKFNNL
jgi:hypothetical protein